MRENIHTSGWTPQEDADLRRMWNAEGMNARLISKQLPGRSRSAILGYIDRHEGFERRGNGQRSPLTPEQVQVRKDKHAALERAGRARRQVSKPAMSKPKPQPRSRPTSAAPSLRLTLLELNANDCHFIEGDDHRYCGNPAEELQPYCPGHMRIVYQPVSARAR